MSITNFIIIIIGLIIIWQSYILIKKQYKLKKDMEKALNDWDRNIDFSGYVGSGISSKKKNYPDLEIKDDFRQTIGENNEHKGNKRK